jgi:hypothetical protein
MISDAPLRALPASPVEAGVVEDRNERALVFTVN